MFELPKWAKEILRFNSIKSQFILEGNIYDVYPIEMKYRIYPSHLTSQPMVNQPGVNQPGVNQPGVNPRMVNQPVVNQPMVNQPMVNQPMVNQPMVNQPMVNQPMVNQPMVNQPMVSQPMVNQPMVSQPMVNQPMVSQPMVNQPMVNQPTINPSAVNQPMVNQPTVNPSNMIAQSGQAIYSEEIKEVVTLRLVDFLGILMTEHEKYDMIVSFEPIFGFRLIKGDPENFRRFVKENPNKDGFVPAILSRAYEAIENMVNTTDLHISVIINFASRLKEIAERDIQEFLYKMFRLSQNALPKIAPSNDSKHPKFNVVFILLDKETDLPAWYSLDNHKVKVINIPRPDNIVRRTIIETLLPRMNDYEKIKDDQNKKEEIIDVFIDNTHKMFGTEIIGIVSLARKENISVLEINEAIRRYKVGVKDNPWAKLNWNDIANAEEILKKRVKGQDKAIKKACEIIRRSFFDISGSQFGIGSSRPKGVMFFAGPTGVGKTELAKAITELIFGNQSSYIRFDMSEYSKEHTDQRLIGAPPGYVGYDAGGQLTNAIKQNPFSIVLFDEIEKAHPRILDIFLQILDEGRLTSGRGETVYFTECIIIFTSNLGVYDMDIHGNKIIRVSPDMSYEQVETEIKNFIQDYFKFRISRPEILNRIGENIIVFDFIRPQSAKLIFEKMINNVKHRIYDMRKLNIEISPEAYDLLQNYCTKDLSMGGRGIGNKIEEIFVNPLSTLLFKLNPREGQTIQIENIYQTELGWELKGRIMDVVTNK